VRGMNSSPARRKSLRALLCLAALIPLVITTVLDSPAGAAPATTVPPVSVANPNNPLANRTWGHDTTPVNDGAYPAYQQATGINKTRLARVALRPRAHWFGSWNPTSGVASTVRTYIGEVQAGNPNTLVQMALFDITPWEGAACHHAFTTTEISNYKSWINQVAVAIGAAHVAVILQPDLPFAYCSANYRVPTNQMVAYAAATLSHLQNTSVYIDTGAGDWYSVANAVNLLRWAGVAYTRGFAINATHYDSVTSEINYGSQIVAALNKLNITALKNKHFVIDTAQNGKPFTAQQFKVDHPGADYNNPPACSTTTQLRCVTLGIPPTYKVAEYRWKIPATQARLASYEVDGFLWFGRPWLFTSDPSKAKTFNLARTLAISRTTPWWNTSDTKMP
jgi:endoglucanase